MNKEKFETVEKEIQKLENHYPYSDLKHVYEKHKEQIYEILYCVARIKEKKQIDNLDLEILEKGIRNSWEEVFYYQAGKYLSEFSYKYENARQLFYKLYNDNDYKIRFRVVTTLLNEPQGQIIKDILTKALNDRSSKVREKAEDVIIRLNIHWKYNFIKKASLPKLNENK